jgi:sulfur carrier protein
MRITVKFFAGFREGRFRAREVEFPGPLTVAELLKRFSVPEAEVGVLLCNGRHVEFSHLLKDGDSCSIFPKVGGG